MRLFAGALKTRAMLGLFIFLSAASLVRAEIASNWVDGMNSRARLIAGTIGTGNIAGLEITLTPGWKTYWRNPGDGGIAPAFNWVGSENVRDVSVLFPFPNRYADNYGTAIGYKNNVIFPVLFEPDDPMKPQILRLQVDYAVCEALCIPAEAELELRLPGGVSFGSSPRLREVVAQVPRDADKYAGRIVSVVQGDSSSLTFEARFSGEPGEAEIFVEGPTAWFLPAPEEIQRVAANGDTLIEYRLDLSHLPKDATISGETILFSIKSDMRVVEQRWQLN